MIARRLIVATTMALSVGAGLQLVGAQAAAAAASPRASCAGIESSEISPPGISDEFPGGRPQLAHFVIDLARELGVTPGAIVSDIAHVHAGSHDACDE